MGAEKLSPRFKIPLQGELQAYMKERKGWPDQFCIYYAERFWEHYNAKGWRIGSSPMKSWKSAFNSQWQMVKYLEDIEALKKFGGKAEPAKVFHYMTKQEMKLPENNVEILDYLLKKYEQAPTLIKFEDLAKYYAMIKELKLWDRTITKQDIEEIKSLYPEEIKRQAWVVERTLKSYVTTGWTFAKTLSVRNQLK